MKIILSRKGCDSDFGGIPSIILPDGKLIYIPIPGGNYEKICYNDILINKGQEKLIEKLNQVTQYIHLNKQKCPVSPNLKCHFDPDLDYMAYPRMNEWKGCFGQAGAAQTVLENSNVCEGDIFLFFGWFKQTYLKNGKLHYCSGPGMHMIFGWLQIDKLLYTNKMTIPEWLKYHPHSLTECRYRDSNCIYIGKEKLDWNNKIPGYGIFTEIKDALILTKEGYSRSRWNLPKEFQNLKITYHSSNSWKKDYFQSACRGQEFVFEENSHVETWAKKIMECT